jgi:MoaA/NifB/PqqE/SkfB family radical SAM enzyme
MKPSISPVKSDRAQVRAGHALRSAARILESRVLGHHRPLFVNIEPTHRCNLDCSYCDKTGPRAPQMETADALRLIDELADAGTLSVCFDGGEPLIHPGIGEMIRAARRRGLLVSISTNGSLIPRRIDEIAAANFVKISIDGPAAVHDAARGEGSFAKAIAGAKVAKDRGLVVAIRMTIAEHNVHAHRHVLAVARELGVTALFQPAIGSLFDARKHAAEHSPHVRDYRATIDDLIALKLRGAPVANELLALRHLRNWPDPVPVPFCGGGRVMAAIGRGGEVYPCGRVGRDTEAPNALEKGVQAAYEEVLRPTDCASCWCSLTASNCFAYRLDPRLLEGRLYGVPEQDATLSLLPDEASALAAATVAPKLVRIRKKYPSAGGAAGG